jgi:hypothetical protein
MRKMRFPLVWLATMALLAALTAATASAAGVCSSTTPQYCPRPTVVTGPATNVKTTSATLTGTVVANGAPTECTFEYGLTTAYGMFTALTPEGSGTTVVPVSATINGLSPKTKFHYQLVCTNAGGTGLGGDRDFTTLDHGKSHPAIGGKAGFVSSKGVVGFVIVCFGDRSCVGKLSLTSKGKPLAKARKYSIKSQHLKVVYLKLSSEQLKRLNRLHKLTGKLIAKDSDGPKATANVTLHRWI